LPPLIADSLPDSWGNTLFDKWVNDNNVPRSKITPLYKLMFIGRRGMGALEFEPAAEDLCHIQKKDATRQGEIREMNNSQTEALSQMHCEETFS